MDNVENITEENSSEADSTELNAGGCILPLEIIEKILSYVDADTLLNCEGISPEFTAAVEYLSSKEIWRNCCLREMTRRDIELQIIAKLYPHHPHYNCPRTWRGIYRCWFKLKQLTKVKTWQMSALNLDKGYSEILQVTTHGNLILALVNYRRDLNTYNKIITVNDKDVVIDKSCRFDYDTLYLAPMEGLKFDQDNIMLHCNRCTLIGIPPIRSTPRKRQFPRIALGTNKINVFQSNGEFLFFRNTAGLLDKSKCGSIKESTNFDSATCFVRVICEFSSVYISCDDIYREFVTLQTLHSRITCSLFFASVLFLGTDSGMVYGYYCRDKYDILNLDLTEFTWRFNVSSDPLVAIDIMVTDKQISLVCCDGSTIYRLVPKH